MRASFYNRSERVGVHTQVRARHVMTVLMAALLAACGGGGGGGADASPVGGGVNEPPVNVPDPVITIDAIPSDTSAFHIVVDQRWADPGQIERMTGGPTQRYWNMADAQHTMTPGMKLAFFGRSPECGSTKISDGPVNAGSDTEFTHISERTAVAAAATAADTRWTPSAETPACPTDVHGRTGPHWIYLNPQAKGGMAVYTAVGPDTNGRQPFLLATPSGGTDGEGYNANGIATFVAFRRAWSDAAAVRPWRGSDGQTAEARIVARQSVGAMEVGVAADGVTAQVKQQVMFTVINTTCQQQKLKSGAGCHVQYLFNTAAVRAGVTDWEAYSPAQVTNLWFDKNQGAMPVLAGQVPEAGQATRETGSKLTTYRSAGAGTRHGPFSDQPFDIRIGFDEFLNTVRLIASRQLNLPVGEVTDAQLEQVYGPDWNNTDKWTLISTTFGQEIHNSQFESRRAWIGGGFSEIYAGPAR